MERIFKFPRTPHLESSRLQPGDQDLSQVPFKEIAGRFLVVEEKVDGANCGIGFTTSGALQLQSRGHCLTGGVREKQFGMLKQWAAANQAGLFERLGSRYLMYGEWMFAKHTIFYNRLPHYFLEFDVLDRQTERFLSTSHRRNLLHGLPMHSVPVLYEGRLENLDDVVALIGSSAFIDQRAIQDLEKAARDTKQTPEAVLRETDASGLMEGLYIKVEEDGQVANRLKFVRADFLAVVDQSGSHWQDRPMIRNLLREQ